ncbi:MAG: RHS repeat-associated core domain-containing protein [Micrococcales bacterium]|nr:RHS repeat-associated core domain-containing protein [Micrococcales bacterium]MCL2667508.1 RHS repeat-associated core domain-containing protein [Micrococcales bacterium]
MPTVLVDAEHTYVYGLGDTPLAQVDTNGDVVYLHTDLVGSVRTATADDTHAVCDIDYDPYGQPQPVTTDPCTGVTRFGYAGQYTDPTGLQYLRNRYYDPDTAQFLSVDPLVEVTGDPYGYAGGNPLQNTDPLGLDWLGINEGEALRFASDLSAGFGDFWTMGGTKAIRQLFLIDGVVNYCSTAYAWGGYAGMATSFALPIGGGSLATKAAFPTFGKMASGLTAHWGRMKPYFGESLGAIGPRVGRAGAGGGELIRVADFRSEAAAFEHYTKHVKGVVLKNGRATPKKGGLDMPEFASYAEYRSAAREFMGAGLQPGAIERVRDGDIVRADLTRRYYGVRASDGDIRTFFRPNEDILSYFLTH